MHDIPKLCKFLSFDNWQKRFLWAHKEVDLVPHPVIGCMLQVGGAERFLQAVGLESLDPFAFLLHAGSNIIKIPTSH